MAKYKATTKSGQCIFCAIARENTSTPGLFWQDAEFMAWLAIDPNTKGFTCVIPKQHFGSERKKLASDIIQKQKQ